jgi:hypothetical protein
MGKYGESLGIWELKIGGANLKLKPLNGDNYKLMDAMIEAKKTKNEAIMMKNVANLLKEMIKRDCPPDNEQEENELDEYVEFNILALLEEMMVKFRWATKEGLEKTKGDALKNENPLVQN